MKNLIPLLFAVVCLWSCSGRKSTTVSTAGAVNNAAMNPQTDTIRSGEMRVGNIKDTLDF